MYMQYEVGCVLFKNAAAHRAAFTTAVNYLTAHERGLASGPETTFQLRHGTFPGL
jgi:aromatic-L-amino-acid decarboxylase